MLAARTRQARLDPIVRALLDAAFIRLGLVDPTGHVKDAIARYPHDAVLAGLATFDGKRSAGTLPASPGPRYLLGIVRHEGLAIAEALWCPVSSTFRSSRPNMDPSSTTSDQR